MCIKKTESYEYKGILYPTEKSAVDAAMGVMAENFANAPQPEAKRRLALHASELVDLLQYFLRVNPGQEEVAGKPDTRQLTEHHPRCRALEPVLGEDCNCSARLPGVTGDLYIIDKSCKHDWVPDKRSTSGLIDECTKCGETRA